MKAVAVTQERQQEVSDELERVKRHQLRHKHLSVRSIWDEYYGLGEFKGVPIDGGIIALEAKYKTAWRNGKGTANRMSVAVGRSKMVVAAIQQPARGRENQSGASFGVSRVEDHIEKKRHIGRDTSRQSSQRRSSAKQKAEWGRGGPWLVKLPIFFSYKFIVCIRLSIFSS